MAFHIVERSIGGRGPHGVGAYMLYCEFEL